MNKKTMIIIIVILTVILLAGIVAIMVLSNPATSNVGDDQLSSTDSSQADAPAQEDKAEQNQEATEETGQVDIPDDVTAGTNREEPEAPTKGSTEETPVTPTKGNETSKDPTTPTKNPITPTKPSQQGTTTPTIPEETEPEVPYFPEATDTPAPEKDEVTYMDYHSMTATEQKAFINTFESYDAFFEWHEAAKKAYEDGLIEIDGSTPVNMEDIVGGN